MRAGGEVHYSSHVKNFRVLRGRRVVVFGDDVSTYDYCAAVREVGRRWLRYRAAGRLHDVPRVGRPLSAEGRRRSPVASLSTRWTW